MCPGRRKSPPRAHLPSVSPRRRLAQRIPSSNDLVIWQRAAIARALLCGADVLLLDEPATGLDPAAKASLRDLLTRLARERLVVVVDHEGVFDSVADQVIDL